MLVRVFTKHTSSSLLTAQAFICIRFWVALFKVSVKKFQISLIAFRWTSCNRFVLDLLCQTDRRIFLKLWNKEWLMSILTKQEEVESKRMRIKEVTILNIIEAHSFHSVSTIYNMFMCKELFQYKHLAFLMTECNNFCIFQR